MKVIAKNKNAKFKYELIDKFEAGIALKGTEIKSLRQNGATLLDAFVTITNNNEAVLLNCHISEWKFAGSFNHEPTRTRKLLLHKKEIKKIKDARKKEGLTCVPYILYLNPKGYAKLEIYIARGKKLHDKRKAIKERDEHRHQSRQFKRRR